MILQNDRDPLDSSSFGPVSLVNINCKLLTNILVMMLEKILKDIIHEDQVGFVKQRSASDNL